MTRRWLLSGWVLVLLSCDGGPNKSEQLREQVLKSLTDEVILPTYRAFDRESGELVGALDALAQAPAADSLAAAQAAWREARVEWKRQDAFRFGPADALGTQYKVDQAVDSDALQAMLEDDSVPLDVAGVSALGSNRKGLLAMEFLLFDADGGDAAVLEALSKGPTAARRGEYLRSLGQVMREEAAKLLDAWEPERGDYANALTQAGSGSKEFETQKQAVDALANRLIFSVESAELKLAKPLGLDSGGQVRPELVEARRSGHSLQDLLEVLEGVRRVYVGLDPSGGQLGLSDLMQARNTEVDGRVVAQLAQARAALEAVPAPLRTALTEHKDVVEAARAALGELHGTFATEVASNLGVTLKFNDNDGD